MSWVRSDREILPRPTTHTSEDKDTKEYFKDIDLNSTVVLIPYREKEKLHFIFFTKI